MANLLTRKACCPNCRGVMHPGEPFVWTTASRPTSKPGIRREVSTPAHPHDCLTAKAMRLQAERVAEDAENRRRAYEMGREMLAEIGATPEFLEQWRVAHAA